MSDRLKKNRYDLMSQMSEIPTDELEQQFIQLGKLTDRQVVQVRDMQKHKGIGFFDAALCLGVVRRENLISALSKQYSYPIISSENECARFSNELVVGREPFGPIAETIRSIRASLVSSAVALGTRSFAIIGPRHDVGCTFLAGNLALAFAQMSVQTLLVDANLRNPRISEMFGLSRNTLGLSETLAFKRSDQSATIAFDILPGLSVMTSGCIPPNPQELLCSEQFLALTQTLSRDFGVVIYDTPNALDYADAYVLASRVGSSMIVARKHKTSFEDVSTLAAKLRGLECNLVGSVLNDF